MPQEEHNSLYTASYKSIFFKNLLAGFAYGIGGMMVYLVMIGIVYGFFNLVVLPKLQPLFDTFNKTQQNLEKLSNPKNPFEGLFGGEPTPVIDSPRRTN